MGAVLLAAPSVLAQDAHQPIEGVWAQSATATGRTLVEAFGPNGFHGTIVRGSDPRRCAPDAAGFVHPFAATVWKLAGSGSVYSGTTVYFDARCRPLGEGQASWTVNATGGRPTLRLCANRPGGGPPTIDATGRPTGTTSCTDLARVAPPKSPPTFAAVVTMPATSRCVPRRAFTIRLHDGSNDPLRAAKVSVDGIVRRVVNGAPLTGSIVLRHLPRGRLSVRVVVTTATGRKLVGQRGYRGCRG